MREQYLRDCASLTNTRIKNNHIVYTFMYMYIYMYNYYTETHACIKFVYSLRDQNA